jgi:MFS family permease
MTTLGQLLAPCGYGSNAAGLVGGLLLLFGLFGAVAAGVILDQTHRYRLLLRLAFGGTAAAVVGVLALLGDGTHHWPAALAVAFSVLGLVMLPLLPITMEAAAEATFPIPELVSSGLLLTSANLVGIPIVLLLSFLLDKDTCRHFLRPSVVLILVIVAAAALPLVLYGGRTKRLEAEAQAEAEVAAIRESERDGSIF